MTKYALQKKARLFFAETAQKFEFFILFSLVNIHNYGKLTLNMAV